MATDYLKNGKLYVGYMDATIGRQRCERAPKELGADKDLGLRYAEKIEEKLRTQAEIVGKKAGPLTVRIWFADWSKRRRAEGLSSAEDDERRIRIHVLQANPEFADMPLDAVRRRHTKALLSKLKAKIGTEKERLGARTVRNIWGALSSMFEDAVDSEVLSANPCKLKRGSLPKRSDKDATWRSTAIFARREIEQIVVDDQTPWDRRMFYAACFFAGGARFGEAAARRWRDYDPELRPLGRLKIETSYSTKTKKEKNVKTEVARNVPVHPVYAALLAEWKLSGWEQLMGRAPGPDDLIVPSREGAFRNANHMLHRFHEDLERIGLRTAPPPRPTANLHLALPRGRRQQGAASLGNPWRDLGRDGHVHDADLGGALLAGLGPEARSPARRDHRATEARRRRCRRWRRWRRSPRLRRRIDRRYYPTTGSVVYSSMMSPSGPCVAKCSVSATAPSGPDSRDRRYAHRLLGAHAGQPVEQLAFVDSATIPPGCAG